MSALPASVQGKALAVVVARRLEALGERGEPITLAELIERRMAANRRGKLTRFWG